MSGTFSGAFSFAFARSAASSAYQRMLLALLPPGKVWRDTLDSVLAKLMLGSADELDRVDGRVADLLDEADPSTADELLPEYERELALTAAATIEERRANIVGRLVRRQRFRPVDFQQALAALLGQDPADVVIIERTRAFCITVGDDREIFRFFIYRDPTLPGTYYLASAQALVDAMKPSHTLGYVIESVYFLCDDPFSLCDRDLIGDDTEPTLVGYGAPSYNTPTLTPPGNPLSRDGDVELMIVGAMWNSGSPSLIPTPAGWTSLVGIGQAIGGQEQEFALFMRLLFQADLDANGGLPPPVSITTGGDENYAVRVTVHGPGRFPTVDGAVIVYSSTSFSSSPITTGGGITTGVDDLILTFVIGQASASGPPPHFAATNPTAPNPVVVFDMELAQSTGKFGLLSLFADAMPLPGTAPLTTITPGVVTNTTAITIALKA